tara:strand:+ start:179 stop:331 length:153 start_codon:yes stop_codon:yes gene_type:complete
MTESQIKNLRYLIATQIYKATGRKASIENMNEIMAVIARGSSGASEGGER